jgi:hypothetical protein
VLRGKITRNERDASDFRVKHACNAADPVFLPVGKDRME